MKPHHRFERFLLYHIFMGLGVWLGGRALVKPWVPLYWNNEHQGQDQADHGTRGSHFTDQNMKPTEIVTSRNLQNILVWTQAMKEGEGSHNRTHALASCSAFPPAREEEGSYPRPSLPCGLGCSNTPWGHSLFLRLLFLFLPVPSSFLNWSSTEPNEGIMTIWPQ